MSRVSVIIVSADERSYVYGVYRNAEDAQAELNNPAYGEPGSERWHDHWVDGAHIETYELK